MVRLNQHCVPRTTWQDNVNAEVGKACQIFSFCHNLRNQATTELSILKVVPDSADRREGQYSQAATDRHKIARQSGITMVPK